MRKHAVVITVLFALGVTLLSVSVVFWEFFKLNKQQYVNHIFTKHVIITQIYRENMQRNNSQIMLEANLAVYNFVIEKNTQRHDIIIKQSKILKSKEFKSVQKALKLSKMGFYTQKTVTDLTATMLLFNKKIYFYFYLLYLREYKGQ